ncbi:MAG TPA: PKD domain-containing protein [Solirubrobacteraceae bacterium]|nr:PKD domain-containing protein [Solirubrobacteraceae bacterium]
MISQYASPPLRAAARHLRLALVVPVALLVLLMSGTPARAIVVHVGPANAGLQPFSGAIFDGNGNGAGGAPDEATFGNAAGNPVMHVNHTYAIYWDPSDSYHGDWQTLINRYLQDVSVASGTLDNSFAAAAQYTDVTNQHAAYNSIFRGAYTDTNSYPAFGGCADSNPLTSGVVHACLTDAQIQQELSTFISTQHTLEKGMGSIFYVLTPPGVTVCLDGGAGGDPYCSSNAAEPGNGFCSYHSAITPTNPVTGDANSIIYAMIPWSAGGLDDAHLAPADQFQVNDCQDGAWDPSPPNPEHKEVAPAQPPTEQQPNQSSSTGPDGTYDGALADLIINQVGVEQQNTVTNPLLNAWQDAQGNEASDQCRDWFAPYLGGAAAPQQNTNTGTLYNQVINGHGYYVNTAFNLAGAPHGDLGGLLVPYPGVPCVGGVSLVPSFSVPNGISAGDIVGFDGMESNITLNLGENFTPGGGPPQAAYPTFVWDFGDGSVPVSGFAPGGAIVNSGATPCPLPWASPCAGSTFHTFQYGGTYQVSLKVTDVGGNISTLTKPVTVAGPPAPGSGGSGGSGSGGSGSGSSGSGSGTGTGGSSGGSAGGSTPQVIAAPVASAAASGGSLRKILKRGLTVRYRVNEQVAGHFEVLLDRGVASHLGIHGPAPAGMPAGATPSVVIAKALLITTKSGRSTVRIQFSKRTAARMKRLRKVKLTLRLIVRNAATTNPKSVTVVSTVQLHR